MDQIFIRDLQVRGIIGVNERERLMKQDILINIVIFTDAQQAGLNDELELSVDYSDTAKKAISIAETANRYTVEALAEDIARMCLDQPHVQKVHVRVEKPGAIRFARSVGVEIERSQVEKRQAG